MTRRSGRERFTELLFYAVVLLVAYLALQVIWPFLSPLAWAGILALSLRGVYLRFCIRLSNGNAALVTTLLAGVLVIAPAAFLIGVLAQQVPDAINYINTVAAASPEQLTRLWETVRAYSPVSLPADPMALVVQGARTVAAFIASRAGSLVADVLATLGSMLVMLFALFFFLRDGRRFGEAVRRLLPFSEEESERLIAETTELFVASVGAGLTVAFIQGLIGGLAFWVLGLPAPVVWGSAIAICSLIPVVGATIVWVPVALWLLVSGEITRGLLMTGLCGAILGSADNVLRPLLLAGRTSANGLVVFIGLLGGVSAFGFVGLVLGPIVLVTAGSLIDALTRRVHVPTSESVTVVER
jgi:predicted PurR-regulated permease PerM